jgi:hypothetical protein
LTKRRTAGKRTKLRETVADAITRKRTKLKEARLKMNKCMMPSQGENKAQ